MTTDAALRRIYIDQLHLGPQADREIERLVQYVEAGKVRVPISLTHALESAKDKPARRDSVRDRLLRLSQGEVLAGELRVMSLEARAHRLDRPHEWVRERAVSSNACDWLVGHGSPFWLRLAGSALTLRTDTLFRAARVLPDDRRVAQAMNDVLRVGAARANGDGPTSRSMTSVLVTAGLIAPEAQVPERDLAVRFRALGARRALQAAISTARASGLEANDLTDVAFLSVALPYLDAVVVDRRMLARIEEARSTVPVPWARAYRRLDDLLAVLDSAA